MDKEEPSSKQLPPEIVVSLLRDARQAQKQGNHAKARSLLRVLTIHHPEDTRAWLLLATVAADRDEQRFALEQVVARNSDHPLAKRGLATLQNSTSQKQSVDGASYQTKPIPKVDSFVPAQTMPPAKPKLPEREEEQLPQKSPTHTVALPQFSEADSRTPTEEQRVPATEDARKEPHIDPTTAKTEKPWPQSTMASPFLENIARFRWVLYIVLAIAVILFFLIMVFQDTPSENEDVEQTDPTPSLPGAGRTQPPFASNTHPEALQGEIIAIPLVSTDSILPTRPPTQTPEPELRVSTLSLGRPVQQDDWYVSLLRPEDAVFVQGDLGHIQTEGQFLIVLMTVSNGSAEAIQMPANLITLLDSEQNRYKALPRASTVYLDSYGRGQYGDLSMEELIPPGGGNVSIPLIFDVPITANDFHLYMEGVDAAWPIDTSFTAIVPTILPTIVLTSTITPTP